MLNSIVSLLYAMGDIPQGSPQQGAQSFIPTLIMFALIFVIFYFLLIRPQMKQQKKHQEMLTSLKKGDKVLTSGGLYGVVVGISDRDNIIVIRIDENTKVEVGKGYIIGVKREGQEVVIDQSK
ncbi:MAG: preprotein translocase subunit YajC [Candidatus Firestonebacteria bacterium]